MQPEITGRGTESLKWLILLLFVTGVALYFVAMILVAATWPAGEESPPYATMNSAAVLSVFGASLNTVAFTLVILRAWRRGREKRRLEEIAVKSGTAGKS